MHFLGRGLERCSLGKPEFSESHLLYRIGIDVHDRFFSAPSSDEIRLIPSGSNVSIAMSTLVLRVSPARRMRVA
jgi:hypothetical protein